MSCSYPISIQNMKSLIKIAILHGTFLKKLGIIASNGFNIFVEGVWSVKNKCEKYKDEKPSDVGGKD